MKLDFEKSIKDGVEQAMKECELTIGMTLKEAVEKQIPKKIVLKNCVNLLRGKEYCCPNPICNKFFGYQYESAIEEIFENYCPDCGQALDWEDF